MVNLANINLGKDLAKLPLAERLNIMMHYRAAEFLRQLTPISKLEYETLDASIRSNDEIRAYNKMNDAYHKLFYQFDYTVKCVVGVELRSEHFKLLWSLNKQTEMILDGLSHFLYSLSENLQDNAGKKVDYDDLMFDCLKDEGLPFARFEQEVDEDGSKWLVNNLNYGGSYQLKSADLKAVFAKLETAIAKYHELAETENLHLKPFTEAISILLAEAKQHMRWLERLEKISG